METSAARPDEIDVADDAHVDWVRAQCDPALWHLAAMAALAYRGDPHGFLLWLVQQPQMDRATAGWIFFWAEGARYLRGETQFHLSKYASAKMFALFEALCLRSERVGFAESSLGLDEDFEPERRACLEVVAAGRVTEGVIVPHVLLNMPFPRPRADKRYVLDDGLILAL